MVLMIAQAQQSRFLASRRNDSAVAVRGALPVKSAGRLLSRLEGNVICTNRSGSAASNRNLPLKSMMFVRV